MESFVVAVLKTVNCTDCAKHVYNDCKVRSRCSDSCEMDVKTTEVELSKDDDNEISVEVEGCCHVSNK